MQTLAFGPSPIPSRVGSFTCAGVGGRAPVVVFVSWLLVSMPYVCVRVAEKHVVVLYVQQQQEEAGSAGLFKPISGSRGVQKPDPLTDEFWGKNHSSFFSSPLTAF